MRLVLGYAVLYIIRTFFDLFGFISYIIRITQLIYITFTEFIDKMVIWVLTLGHERKSDYMRKCSLW